MYQSVPHKAINVFNKTGQKYGPLSGYLYGLGETTTKSKKEATLKMLERDWKTEEDPTKEGIKGEKSKTSSDPEDETTDDQGDTDSQDGEYFEQLSEDEQKYVDSELVGLDTDIRSLSVSETPREDGMERCQYCDMDTRNLKSHQWLTGCKLHGYPESKETMKGRE